MKERCGKECYSIKQDESLTKEGPNNLWGYHFESANRKSNITSCIYSLKAHVSSDLQPHYDNGVFGNVDFLALANTNCQCPIVVITLIEFGDLLAKTVFDVT